MTTTPGPRSWRDDDARVAWLLAGPALGTIALVVLFPIAGTIWESIHVHDLRMPWLGRPLVGMANYVEALGDVRLRAALANTLLFVAVSVSMEMAFGLVLALALDRLSRGRELIRTAVLLPWAIPTVVAALIWRFMFEAPAGLAITLPAQFGLTAPTWFADETAAWIPLVLADVWKTTPFVAVLLVAGLQGIDRSVYEAAAVDGARSGRQFLEVTLPLLAPALLVAALFRVLDAFRVFDVVYVMTAGGPGTATEPIALYTFTTLLQNLRFGYGAALSVISFLVAFGLALAGILIFRRTALEEPAA